MSRRPEIDVVVLAGAIVLAVAPLLPVFGLDALMLPVVLGALLGTATALVAARMAWGTAVTMALALGAFLLFGPVVAVPDQTFAGVLPSVPALLTLLSGVVTSWKLVLTLDPQLGVTGGVLVAPFFLVMTGSFSALTVAVRVKGRAVALAAVIPLVVLMVSTLLGTKTSVAPAPIGVVLLLVLGTWASWRVGTLAPRRVLSLALLATVVASVGSVGGPWLADQRPRFVLRDEIVPPFDPAEQVSPLSSFRVFVKDWEDTELLTVRGLPQGATVRLATMDAFDGVVWNVAGAQAADGSGSFRRVGSEVDTRSRRGTHATVEFEARDLPFVWLPTVGWSEQITFADADAQFRSELRYNDATGTAVLVDGVPSGLRWSSDVVVPDTPGDSSLQSADAGSAALPTPLGVPASVEQHATDLAGTATSAGLIASSLAEGLSQSGYFSHGLVDRGEAFSPAGHGAYRIERLLSADPMVGDGEQYASAMALMAREMGLPARVVLGFVPEDGAGELIVFTGADIQAWVEVELAGYGWVAFFPTPDESRTPDQNDEQQDSQSDPQVRQPPPPPEPPVTAPEDDTEQPSTQDDQQQDRSTDVWAILGRIAVYGGIPLIVIVGPPLLIAALKGRRRRRRRGEPEPSAQVVGGWDELVDSAIDLRLPVPQNSTRREFAVSLASAVAEREVGSRRSARIGGPVATLAARADEAVFGAQDPTQKQVDAFWVQVDDAVVALRAASPTRSRWLSRISLASLRRRRGRR